MSFCNGLLIILIALIAVGLLGFFVNVASPIGNKNYAMPDIPENWSKEVGIPQECPSRCDFNMSYKGCNITACDYHYCKVWWYTVCVVK